MQTVALFLNTIEHNSTGYFLRCLFHLFYYNASIYSLFVRVISVFGSNNVNNVIQKHSIGML